MSQFQSKKLQEINKSVNNYLSINLGNQSMAEEKNEMTIFEGLVIP